LIRQRHLTPSCGGHAPTAERTAGPARMIVESLTPRPGIRERHRPQAVIGMAVSLRRNKRLDAYSISLVDDGKQVRRRGEA
jgi:hypothetical protein